MKSLGLYPVCMGTYANHFNPEGMEHRFCDAAPVVSSHGLQCSDEKCIWSQRWVTEQEWNHRNCQGICARLKFGVQFEKG